MFWWWRDTRLHRSIEAGPLVLLIFWHSLCCYSNLTWQGRCSPTSDLTHYPHYGTTYSLSYEEQLSSSRIGYFDGDKIYILSTSFLLINLKFSLIFQIWYFFPTVRGIYNPTFASAINPNAAKTNVGSYTPSKSEFCNFFMSYSILVWVSSFGGGVGW